MGMFGARAEGGHGQLCAHEDERDDAENGMRVGCQVGLDILKVEKIRGLMESTLLLNFPVVEEEVFLDSQ